MIINSWLLFLISLMLLSSTLMIMQSHITSLIKLLILQNIILACYILTKALHHPELALWISFAITTFIKVIVLPVLLWKLTRFLKLSGRIEPIVNKATLLIIATVMILFGLLLGHKTAVIIPHALLSGFSLGLANAFVAVILIIFRRKAVSQVIGLLVLENSIFIIAATLSTGFPWLIELGMSFDILMGFMIFTLFLIRIRQQYGSFQMSHIEKLRERV